MVSSLSNVIAFVGFNYRFYLVPSFMTGMRAISIMASIVLVGSVYLKNRHSPILVSIIYGLFSIFDCLPNIYLRGDNFLICNFSIPSQVDSSKIIEKTSYLKEKEEESSSYLHDAKITNWSFISVYALSSIRFD